MTHQLELRPHAAMPLYTPTKIVSKHRHVEPEYWFNKLNKRRKLAKIARKSRQRNRV